MSSRSHKLRTIAVDLTPILPGGENGGAKIFVLELLRGLATLAPQTQFILLTQATSHEELAILDRPNMRRLMVLGAAPASPQPKAIGLASRLLSRLPAGLRNAISSIGFEPANNTSDLNESGQLLRAHGVDLLYCPFTAPTYFEMGVPTVCTIYDLQHKTYPQFFDAAEVAHRDHIFASACRRATAITAISDYSRRSAIRHGNLDPTRIRTIHLRMAQGIDPDAKHDEGVLTKFGLTPQKYLLYPANFWKHKNHEMLLTAFGMACHTGLAPDVKLVCTGAPGARRDWLINASHAMNLADRVLFPGYLPSAELAVLLANCRGVVFPSLYEGFGLPVIEAMAAGVPVACSNTASLPEVATDAAILFDPRVPTQMAQAIISLVQDQALCANLKERGRLRAAEFSDSKRMVAEYWQIFEYAMDNVKYEDLLTGAYADGWAGRCLDIQVAPAVDSQSLEMDLFAPDWLPQPMVTLQASRYGKKCGATLTMARGSKAKFLLPLDAVGGCYQITITPTFVPSQTTGGDDHRVLAVNLEKCVLLRGESAMVKLFPESVAA